MNKPSGNIQNPHEAISDYGWLNEVSGDTGVSTRPVMVQWVEKGGEAFVKDNSGNKARCQVRTSVNGTKFLQTVSDGRWTDNLLSLPKCVY